MKKALHIIAFLQLSLQLVAQMPNWYLPTSRKEHYPEKEWYTGFEEGTQRDNETTEEVGRRLKNAACIALISNISTTIKHTSISTLRSNLNQNSTYFEEQIEESYLDETTLHTGITKIPNLQIELYFNPKNKGIAAFAYLNKSDVCNFYINQQYVLHKAIYANLGVVDYLLHNKESIKAGEVLKQIKSELIQSDENFKWLLIFGCSEDKIKALLTQHAELKQKIEQLSSCISSNTKFIYISCDGTVFDIPCTTITNQIKSAISGLSCSFTDNRSRADWIIEINTQATSRKKFDEQFVTVSISGIVYCVNKQTSYALSKSSEDSAPNDEKRVANIILQRDLMGDIINDITDILKSK